MFRPLVAVVASSLTAVGLTVPAASASPSSCGAVGTNWTAQAQPHVAPESLLNAYSNTGKGWTGADSTYSVQLPGGRTAWVFSDTFLGPVNPDGSRPTTTPFINNSFVVQQDNTLKTVTGGTPANPTA